MDDADVQEPVDRTEQPSATDGAGVDPTPTGADAEHVCTKVSAIPKVADNSVE